MVVIVILQPPPEEMLVNIALGELTVKEVALLPFKDTWYPVIRPAVGAIGSNQETTNELPEKEDFANVTALVLEVLDFNGGLLF